MHWMLFNYGLFCLLIPLLTILITFFSIYRLIVEAVLKYQLKDRFIGLLDGTDCIWAIEEPSALSVINVLVVLEKDQFQVNSNVLESFRHLIKDRLIGSPFEKILYRKNKKYGYYFWERTEEIDLKERIKWLEHDQTHCDGYCDDIYGKSLKKTLEWKCNQPLPQQHSTCWEILISKNCSRVNNKHVRCMKESHFIVDRGRRNKIKIPVLFRIHHAVGDGTALLKMFLETIADKSNEVSTILKEKCIYTLGGRERKNCERTSLNVPIFTHYVQDFNVCCKQSCYSDSVLSACMPFANPHSLRILKTIVQNYLNAKIKYFEHITFNEFKNEMQILLYNWWIILKEFMTKVVYEHVTNFAKILIVFILMPSYLMEQAIRSMDQNSLHGSKLTGKKIVTYWSEDDYRNSNQQKLITKIKEIKHITGARFVEIFLAALSSSVHKYFLRINEVPPNSLTVVLPAKMGNPKEQVQLSNDISVGLLPLCISEINGKVYSNLDEDSRTIERLQDIMKNNNKLQTDLDYTINFWTMKFLSAVLPEILLKPLIESHSTMIFSNLPGCQEVRILGYSVKNIIFWIPNKSNTGIGFSLFSYNEQVHLSIVADKALVKNDKVFSKILENTVYEIEQLYESLTSTRFSKKFQFNETAPMDKEIGVP
ncbi:PREDICTED: uncharacterized protein LOC106790457 [Polistes canadensis]|uniref:uncharacterized protein LOC106790457 n=1 Tax=Polistes canadensis TaxID=91411 RepID=UPI000718D66A|nr:PREDICTED: uncharacterized protein LOC106790457 [Polistes canadensis]XP_014610837.1 PREDICTED: uncharacterized protein LOC106790457 [Polistes canadensis]